MPGPACPGSRATAPFQLPLEDVKGLVGAPVDVWRGRESRRAAVVEDAERAPGLLIANLVDRQRIEEPERLSLVHSQDQADSGRVFGSAHSVLLASLCANSGETSMKIL